MQKQNILHSDYTLNQRNYQLKLPLNIDCEIAADDSVRLLSQIVEEMDLLKLYQTYSRFRENQATPRQMLKILLYGYMNKRYSSRDIETACRRDINFRFLLEGRSAPDHATIARFRSIHLETCKKELMAQFTSLLYELGEISGEAIFIDGTKIEANANKYTFVWRKAVSKNLTKLLNKIELFVEECEQSYDIKITYSDRIGSKHLKRLYKKLKKIQTEEGITFVHGIGKRKSPIQKSIELLLTYQNRLKDYTKKLHICGNRNSFSKTDEDATFMRMKDDAMKNGQTKPGYNVQHGVDSEYIIWVMLSNRTTDTPTLIPFLKEMDRYLQIHYQKIVADAGYESEENYTYLEESGQLAFIKPTNYEISKTRNYKHDISRMENMDYLPDEDAYFCRNKRKLKKERDIVRKTATGYKVTKTIYACENCNRCKYKSECIRGKNFKTPPSKRIKRLETSRKFNRQRAESLARITSAEGCQLRVNRSIQVEGSFGQIKQDMGFRRFLSRGHKNVETESILIALASNVRKLHNKIQNGRTRHHLFELKSA